jgi:hypothetical protein
MYNLPPPQLPIAGSAAAAGYPVSLGLGAASSSPSLAQVAVAQLRDDVGVVLCVVDLEELQHARREAQLLEVLDFVVEQLSG